MQFPPRASGDQRSPGAAVMPDENRLDSACSRVFEHPLRPFQQLLLMVGMLLDQSTLQIDQQQYGSFHVRLLPFSDNLPPERRNTRGKRDAFLRKNGASAHFERKRTASGSSEKR